MDSLNHSQIRLLVFLFNHNRERFTFSELHDLRFFSSRTTLSKFLKWGCDKKLLKRSENIIHRRKYASYEISSWANDFVAYLKDILNNGN